MEAQHSEKKDTPNAWGYVMAPGAHHGRLTSLGCSGMFGSFSLGSKPTAMGIWLSALDLLSYSVLLQGGRHQHQLQAWAPLRDDLQPGTQKSK